MNLQYSQFITRTEFHKNRIQQMIHGNLDGLKEGEAVDNKTVIERFFGMAGAAVSSYCGDKDCFIGKYHGYGNPIGIINGKLDGSLNYNRNGCGALETEMTLMPGESKSIAFILGMKKDAEAAGIINEYENPEKKCKEELNELIKFWHGKFNAFRVQTPSKEFNTMINTWNAYNCFMTFIWSRADDALWLFPTVYKYIAETGNMAFLDEVISYANKEEDTVYNHLKRAIDFSMNHLGVHGIPVGLHVIAGMKTGLSVALRKNDFQTAFPYRPDL